MKATARSAAFDVLTRIYRDDAYTNLALQHALSTSSLADRDKGLCTEIVYGTVRRQLTIDVLLEPYLKRGLSSLDSGVQTILRMSAYQLAFLERLPAYAIIDEAVELTKRRLRRAAGFVNGVLRSFERAGQANASEATAPTLDARIEDAIRRKKATGLAAIALRTSYPEWMVARLVAAYGEETTVALLDASNRPSPLTVRVNRLRATEVEVREQLLDEGAEVVESGHLSPSALRVRGGIDIESTAAFKDGLVSVQDEGAMLIAPLLQLTPDMRILDMCAAPGGKTTHIAELQGDVGDIDAYDVYLQKVKNIQQAAKRLQLKSIHARLGDARQPFDGDVLYDAVLLDAPCSGLGVMRRRPDIRHRRKPADVDNLATLQRELLFSACSKVRSGGVIVYSTCTLLPEENEQVVESVLAQMDGQFTVDNQISELPEACIDRHHLGTVLTPDAANTDGFFMTRLRKK